MNTRLTLLLAIFIGSFNGCTDPPDEFEAYFGDFILGLERKVAVFDGTIDAESQANLEEMLELYSSVEEIQFENVTGIGTSTNAFAMADLIRSNNINTSVTESGEISQLATYVFLGGEKRTRQGNGKIGVSSWLTNDGTEASSLDEDNAAHEPYIEFLMTKGFSESDAKAFYFFTLNAASSSGNYFLNTDEIQNFGLIN